MRAKTLITGLFALSMAVAGFAALSSMTKKSDAGVPKQQVLSASMELSTGTLLRAQDVTWKPVDTVEADEIGRPSSTQIEVKPEIVEETAASIYGAVLRHPLTAGAAVHRGDIVKPGDRDFLQVVLRPGERAIAIPVVTGGASTGILTPGDHVDVILTQDFKSDQSNDETRNTPLTRRSVGETIVQDLRVLAIDAAETKPSGLIATPASGNFGRTVTLEVTPDQAETINVAAELGKLSVTLRSAEETAATEPSLKEKWAGDVSPALLHAATPKAVALKPEPVVILRGGNVEKDLREQLVKPESASKAEEDK